ncbi:unnamed protein product [Pleuronectes platessa]|uniref:Uncharacterized protein n=1 Tax=Pleuronectes platessa TaxID=8262 RepID=A0A9N7UG49_PLEPL|nr:unnamed protein product [Pleuronectes platessa]
MKKENGGRGGQAVDSERRTERQMNEKRHSGSHVSASARCLEVLSSPEVLGDMDTVSLDLLALLLQGPLASEQPTYQTGAQTHTLLFVSHTDSHSAVVSHTSRASGDVETQPFVIVGGAFKQHACWVWKKVSDRKEEEEGGRGGRRGGRKRRGKREEEGLEV